MTGQLNTSRNDHDTTQTDNIFVIRVGRMQRIESLHKIVASKLHEYSELYRKGKRPTVKINLTELIPGSVGMAALTAFMSLTDRLRNFTEKAIEIDIPWNTSLFSFLDDIGFFRLAQERDVLAIQNEILGGYSIGQTNPNTQLLFFDNSEVPSSEAIGDALPQWKDNIRTRVKESLLINCGNLFRPSKATKDLPIELRDQVAVTAAELVVNSHLWGRSPAFVGLQRSTSRITVCVCDSGIGFFNAIQTRKNLSGFTPTSHFEALVLGCVINKEDFGLRRAIDLVTQVGGTVTISTYSAQITWRAILWRNWVDVVRGIDGSWGDVTKAIHDFRKLCDVLADEGDSRVGYIKEWDLPLRGTRVTFEIPLRRNY